MRRPCPPFAPCARTGAAPRLDLPDDRHPGALRPRPRRELGARALALALALGAAAASAAPYVPTDDAVVLERLPGGRAIDPAARARAELRAALRRDPRDLAAATALARACLEQAGADGDPRWVGCAQAALGPWWTAADATAEVRVLRAVVLQFSHRFEPALADLAAAVQAQPGLAEAWSWRAAIHLVQARYAEARADCERLAALGPPLAGLACRAQVDAATGRAGAAVAALREALARHPDAEPALRLWVLTRLAETEERRGDFAAAEAAFRDALALGRTDVYLLAAYADFLLDRGRAAEVGPLLAAHARADVALLRLALAARATGDPKLEGYRRELAARFDAARRRGDALHEKEEARFALAIEGDAARALALARRNFEVQREPADARVLLEAALAARDRAAAAPALRWLADSGIESVALRALAARVDGLS